jgi:hypothetical protein
MDSFLNLAILRQPLNWLIIFAIGVAWIMALDFTHAYFTGRHPADTAPQSGSIGSR